MLCSCYLHSGLGHGLPEEEIYHGVDPKSQCTPSTSLEGLIAKEHNRVYNIKKSPYNKSIFPLTQRKNHTDPISSPLQPQSKPPNSISTMPVPLTVIKGAGHEHIPIPAGESAIVADFHSIQTQTTDKPTYLTSGFYRIQPGPTRDIPTYTYEETKYVLQGQIDVLDEATGVVHHLVAGDFAFFHVGSKAQFSSKSGGTAFFAVTRPIITQHPGLVGREEKIPGQQSKL